MATVTVSATIHRPVEEVFAFMNDVRNAPKWQASNGLQRIQQMPEGAVGVGTRIIETWKFMGMESEATSEITEYEPNRRLTRVAIGAGPIRQGVTTFEPVADGTRVNVELTVQAGGMFAAVAEPLLVANLRKSFESGFAQLKVLLEQAA
jgi:uncharacterized protein YndB with AHSA1/START domain